MNRAEIRVAQGRGHPCLAEQTAIVQAPVTRAVGQKLERHRAPGAAMPGPEDHTHPVWIEGQGNYAKLHAGRATHLVRTTLSALERELDPARFARVHRSAIVALDRVRELLSLGGGEYRVVLTDGTRVPMSQRYRDRLP
jgi:hypothetical protein